MMRAYNFRGTGEGLDGLVAIIHKEDYQKVPYLLSFDVTMILSNHK